MTSFKEKRLFILTSIYCIFVLLNQNNIQMTYQDKSIFNLIEIFRQGKRKIVNKLNSKKHCEQRSIHDFYCDIERPYISK